ncbi:hypothetical protein [Phenylobacterium sp.]|uniref:hypothetical protein n=1 Tax=Phenylobacterium sp. TaxID=1871053 RepID=UPI0011FCE4F0|nr:hypothetical protein [Phenylobacterium sp.]THD58611.1 MAG: hypothetical protein E8A49_19005 [Phenylobacterium sp.]
MTLRMTLRDVSELKRDPKVATEDISFRDGKMTYLGVFVETGGVTLSDLDRGDTGFLRGAAAAAAAAAAKPKTKAAAKPRAKKAAVKKTPVTADDATAE